MTQCTTTTCSERPPCQNDSRGCSPTQLSRVRLLSNRHCPTCTALPQECLDLLAGVGVPVDRYLVFCKLLRAGYIVQRHPARWLLKPTEDPAAPWAGWGVDPAAGGAAPAAQDVDQGPVATAVQQQQRTAPAVPAVPAGPPRKRRKVEAQVRSMCWWAAGQDAQQPQQQQLPEQQTQQQQVAPQVDQQAEQQAGQQVEQQQQQAGNGDGGTGLPWLRGCLPADFVDCLPRCKLVPDAAQRARADFPRMGPLAAMPLADMLPASGPAGGRHLLVRWVAGWGVSFGDLSAQG